MYCHYMSHSLGASGCFTNIHVNTVLEGYTLEVTIYPVFMKQLNGEVKYCDHVYSKQSYNYTFMLQEV